MDFRALRAPELRSGLGGAHEEVHPEAFADLGDLGAAQRRFFHFSGFWGRPEIIDFGGLGGPGGSGCSLAPTEAVRSCRPLSHS